MLCATGHNQKRHVKMIRFLSKRNEGLILKYNMLHLQNLREIKNTLFSNKI